MRAPYDSHAQLVHFRRLLTVGFVPVTEPAADARPLVRELADLSTLADEGDGATMIATAPCRATQRDASDELAEAQLNLAVRLQRLEELAADMIEDPWAGPAAQAMLARVLELVSLSDAIERVCADARDWRVATMLEDAAPLAEYVRGALAWADGVVRAFDDLAAGLLAFQPDFALVRRRLEDAAAFHLDALVEMVQRDAAALGVDATSSEGRHLEELFWASSWLETSLTARFTAAAA